MADTQPYTQLLGEHEEQISISTAVSVLNALDSVTGDRRRLFHEKHHLDRALEILQKVGRQFEILP